jgi:histidinol dehydrogenase
MLEVFLLANGPLKVLGTTLLESITHYVSFVSSTTSVDADVQLATYGFAKQYSGVNLGSYVKHITSSNLTPEGLRNVGGAVMQLAKVEELEAHRRAVSIRLKWMDENKM